MASENKLLSRREAAELLGLNAGTLAGWHSRGRYGLPVVKVGAAVRYRLTDLLRWIESRTVTPPARQSGRSDPATVGPARKVRAGGGRRR